VIIQRADTWTPRRRSRKLGRVSYSQRTIIFEEAETGDSRGKLNFDTLVLRHENVLETFLLHTETYRDEGGKLHGKLVVNAYGGRVEVRSR